MKPAKATLIRLSTSDGLVAMKEGVLLGTEYVVDADSRRVVTFRNGPSGRIHQKEIVYMVPEEGPCILQHYPFQEIRRWLPTELLRIEEV